MRKFSAQTIPAFVPETNHPYESNPAFEYHRVTLLEAGTRHSLVCWVGGPPFR